MNGSDSSSRSEIPRDTSGSDLPELDFELPEWNGLKPQAPRISYDQWMAHCQSLLPHLRREPGFESRWRENRIEAEFSLTKARD